MGVRDVKKLERETLRFLKSQNRVKTYNAKPLVKDAYRKRNKFLRIAEKHGTPFYVYDKEELEKSIKDFQTSFQKNVPRVKIYYAMKANPYPVLLKDIVNNGLGIDASSGLELKAALQAGSKDILFTGPGKTKEELTFLLRNSKKVILNIDSFTELKKLELLLKPHHKLRVGIRVSPLLNTKWTKFGIPLTEVSKIWNRVKKNQSLYPTGIQVHTSWNENAETYKKIINKLADFLNRNSHIKSELKFVDLGGGFLSHETEGLHPWTLPFGKIAQILKEETGSELEFLSNHFESPAMTLENYAKEIGSEIRKRLGDLKCDYYFEPGRIISNNAMHILLKVEDVKDNNVAITDGGTNMVGWERFEEEYCPILNLTRPSEKEKKALIYGSLCTPHDIWGYYYYGKDLKEGDILAIPYQGAYTYTYAQHFIKAFPRVYSL